MSFNLGKGYGNENQGAAIYSLNQEKSRTQEGTLDENRE